MNALTPIIEQTRRDVAVRARTTPSEALRRAAEERVRDDPPRGFAAALRGPGISIIAEHKRSSPSAGVIRDDLVLEDVVAAYERGGAAAVSVLTEPHSFAGSLDDLAAARAAAGLPILRKDFIVDPYQVVESTAAGADAILLIVAAVPAAELERLHAEAVALGLGVLVEVHDRAELEVAAGIGAEVIGINNRDLTTLGVDTERTFELLDGMPDGAVVVSESGWRTRSELERLARAGVDAVLVGEALMRASDIEAACLKLAVGGARPARRV
ncbi:MAG TPA: indole-3-glycerol phosphate synthase TrpC [Solirubrobacteraceae bacterium]